MKIAVVWPKSTFLIDPMVYPPLGAWTIAEALRRNGVTVDFFDLDSDTHVNWALYNQVWVSGTTPQAYAIEEFGLELQTQWLVPSVLGGPHATMHAQEMLEFYDTVVVGEVTTSNVMKVAANRSGVLDLGLCQDMFDFPPPDRRWVRRYNAKLNGLPCTSMMTSLGCPYSCAFCASQHLYQHRVRYLPVKTVYEDMTACVARGVKAIQFYDDILPIKRERTYEIADMLMYNDLIWRCFMRSDLGILNGFAFLRDMATSGLVEILVGVESASNTVKRNIHKGTTIEQDTQLLTWCKELGIAYKASVILGLPGETQETMEETRQWLLKYKPDRVDVNVLIPMPGTPIIDNPAQYDCRLVVDHSDEYFYKGRPEDVVAVTETAALTPRDIDDFRSKLLDELRSAGIPY